MESLVFLFAALVIIGKQDGAPAVDLHLVVR